MDAADVRRFFAEKDLVASAPKKNWKVKVTLEKPKEGSKCTETLCNCRKTVHNQWTSMCDKSVLVQQL